jgi:hypothetical protein
VKYLQKEREYSCCGCECVAHRSRPEEGDADQVVFQIDLKLMHLILVARSAALGFGLAVVLLKCSDTSGMDHSFSE